MGGFVHFCHKGKGFCARGVLSWGGVVLGGFVLERFWPYTWYNIPYALGAMSVGQTPSTADDIFYVNKLCI